MTFESVVDSKEREERTMDEMWMGLRFIRSFFQGFVV